MIHSARFADHGEDGRGRYLASWTCSCGESDPTVRTLYQAVKSHMRHRGWRMR